MSDFGDELSVPDELTVELPVPINSRNHQDTTNEKLAEQFNELLEVVKGLAERDEDDNSEEIKQLAERVNRLSGRKIESPDHVMDQSSAGVVFRHPRGFRETESILPSQQESFIGQIGATPTKDGSNFRWSYTWTEMAKTSTGHGGWEAKEEGRTGTAGDADGAFNTMEDMNGASGTFGNGATSANLDTGDYTFTVQPAPSGLLVRIWPMTFFVDSTETTEYWFSYANGVDGSCD